VKSERNQNLIYISRGMIGTHVYTGDARSNTYWPWYENCYFRQIWTINGTAGQYRLEFLCSSLYENSFSDSKVVICAQTDRQTDSVFTRLSKLHEKQGLLSRSQWPCCLRCAPSVVRLLGLRIRIPPGAWMSVSCECCVLWDRGLCVGLITRPEETYRVWCV
jgi:hypothetical protein